MVKCLHDQHGASLSPFRLFRRALLSRTLSPNVPLSLLFCLEGIPPPATSVVTTKCRTPLYVIGRDPTRSIPNCLKLLLGTGIGGGQRVSCVDGFSVGTHHTYLRREKRINKTYGFTISTKLIKNSCNKIQYVIHTYTR